METSTPGSGSAASGAPALDPRRWRALAVLGLIQFMFVVDATVVNVALPRIQRDLGFSRGGLAWVVNGYVLMAAGLLLLGGRLADVFGRRRMFLVGVVVFGLASITSGAAQNPGMLTASRFVQGAGEAIGVPAALGLVFLMFTDTKERMKAVGIWGGVSGLAGTLGVVISGVLTDLTTWRWIFYINVPIALFALALVPRLVSESKMDTEGHRFDFAGAVAATGGLIAVVFGLLQAVDHPWGSGQVAGPLVGGVVLLILTVLIEARSPAPLLPLRFFTDGTRAGTYAVILLVGASFFTFVFLLTLFQQQILGFSPLKGGLAMLPMGILIGVGVGMSAGMTPKAGARGVMIVGLLGAAGGLLLLSRIHPGASYLTVILPGMLMFGLFFGLIMPTTANTALHNVTNQDSSVASAVLNVMQQIGGAVGLAGAATISLRHATSQMAKGVSAPVAMTDGYVLAYRIAAGLLLVGVVLAAVLVKNIKPAPGTMPGIPGPEADAVAGAPAPQPAS